MLIGRAADGSNLNVSAAVDTGKAVQQQRENDQQTAEAPAYQVELSGAKESYKSHWVEKGNTAYLLHHADQSLEDELAEMQAGIDEILSRPRNGIIKSANASLDNLPDNIERVDLSTLPKKELTPELKAAMAELDRIPPPWANIKIDITPRPDITTIKSQHYTWTFA
ncbi:MAG: hypothetical protein IJ709_02575, partial [Selenomonas sp.]|nr:hypothetical protein [Selenomonas sp.]